MTMEAQVVVINQDLLWVIASMQDIDYIGLVNKDAVIFIDEVHRLEESVTSHKTRTFPLEGIVNKFGKNAEALFSAREECVAVFTIGLIPYRNEAAEHKKAERRNDAYIKFKGCSHYGHLVNVHEAMFSYIKAADWKPFDACHLQWTPELGAHMRSLETAIGRLTDYLLADSFAEFIVEHIQKPAALAPELFAESVKKYPNDCCAPAKANKLKCMYKFGSKKLNMNLLAEAISTTCNTADECIAECKKDGEGVPYCDAISLATDASSKVSIQFKPLSVATYIKQSIWVRSTDSGCNNHPSYWKCGSYVCLSATIGESFCLRNGLAVTDSHKISMQHMFNYEKNHAKLHIPLQCQTRPTIKEMGRTGWVCRS